MSFNINELAEGGRGIKLMWQLADELSYTRTAASRNCLMITKTYEEIISSPPNIEKAKILERLIEFIYPWNPLKDKENRELGGDLLIKKIRLQVKTELSALNEVLQWYDQLGKLPIPKLVWWKCQLALAEGFTNAVRHAHRGMPLETPIKLEILVFKGRLEIRIWDCGQPFDLEAKVREIREREQISCFESEGLIGDLLVPSAVEN